MKKMVVCVVPGSVVVAALLAFITSTANARPEYKKQFDALYMTEGSELFKAYQGKSNCNVCHVGKNKKDRNAYGTALSKLLNKEKDAAKIEEALKKVEKSNSVADDEKSPTFGDLIKAGKLPITLE